MSIFEVKIVYNYGYTLVRFLWVSDKFGTCTIVRVNGTLVEDKMRRFKGECEHFILIKGPIYTHDGASVKFSTYSNETDYSVLVLPLTASWVFSSISVNGGQ